MSDTLARLSSHASLGSTFLPHVLSDDDACHDSCSRRVPGARGLARPSRVPSVGGTAHPLNHERDISTAPLHHSGDLLPDSSTVASARFDLDSLILPDQFDTTSTTRRRSAIR